MGERIELNVNTYLIKTGVTNPILAVGYLSTYILRLCEVQLYTFDVFWQKETS